MARNSKTAERVKDGVGGLVKKTRVVVNQGLDTAKESFDDRVDRLDRRYRETVAQVRGRAERVSNNVLGQLVVARKSLLGRYMHARKRVSRLERDARKYAKAHPGKVLLTAAGLGLLVGLAASPRRHLGAAHES
jgi:ElaB/YqjD/DUF883 family membrane-anchored ribosome-binding protein